jgi:hypothetical protein
MITYKDIGRIEKQLRVENLSAGVHWTDDKTNKELIIHNFWIAKFKTYIDYDWFDLMIFVAKSSDAYHGLLLLPNEDFNMLPVEIPNWDHPVENALHNMNIFVEEEPGIIWDGWIRYDFMVSSSSLTSHLEVTTSDKQRFSIDKLTWGIIKTIKQLVKIYNNDRLSNMLEIPIE